MNIYVFTSIVLIVLIYALFMVIAYFAGIYIAFKRNKLLGIICIILPPLAQFIALSYWFGKYFLG